MKTFLLSLCFLALATGQGFAQKTLPAAVKRHAGEMAAPLTKLLNRAGFELETNAFSITSVNALRLDSTKTFTGYDPSGALDSFPILRNIFWYPQNGVRLEMEDQFDGSEWHPVYRYGYFYDELDRLVDVLGQRYDTDVNNYVPDSRLEIFPRGASPELIDSFFVYSWNTEIEDYERLVSNINAFDESDRLIETLTIFDFFGELLVLQDVLHYDNNGDNVLVESFIVADGFEFLIGITENEFLNHLLIESIEWAATGVSFEPVGRTTYAYTNSGLLRQQSTFEFDLEISEWMLTIRSSYEYDDEERISAEETESYGAEEDLFERITYEYLQGSDLAVESAYIKFNTGDDWDLESRKYFYYNTVTSVPEAPRPSLSLKAAPNPTTGVVQLDLENDALVQVFDATGQLRRSFRFQPGRFIDLEGLPAGVYYLIAKDRTNVYSNKVVKL